MFECILLLVLESLVRKRGEAERKLPDEKENNTKGSNNKNDVSWSERRIHPVCSFYSDVEHVPPILYAADIVDALFFFG